MDEIGPSTGSHEPDRVTVDRPSDPKLPVSIEYFVHVENMELVNLSGFVKLTAVGDNLSWRIRVRRAIDR